MEKGHVNNKYEIIVIGGSAGSLEVILNMLQHVTTKQFPIIIVLHRKNSVESMLTEVLSERSKMTVKEAEDKEQIEKGIVYLAPPDYHLLVETDHSLSLDHSEKVNFSRPSIDVTFESAAIAYKNKMIGILLSGGNSDGVMGFRAIQAAGGMCIVQDPVSAEISFMPEYALNNAGVDLVLGAHEFAGFINSLG